MKSPIASHAVPKIALAIPAALVALALALPAPAQAESLCIRANRGTVYAVGDGYARQECRGGDLPYLPATPKTERDLSLCLVEVSAWRTNLTICACPEGEVVEMAGPYASSPGDLVYDLVTTPASGALGEWDPVTTGDYRVVLAQVTSQQSGTVVLALRCAAD